jgi:hypothetical protein
VPRFKAEYLKRSKCEKMISARPSPTTSRGSTVGVIGECLRIGLKKKTKQQRQEIPKKYSMELYSFLALSKHWR